MNQTGSDRVLRTRCLFTGQRVSSCQPLTKGPTSSTVFLTNGLLVTTPAYSVGTRLIIVWSSVFPQSSHAQPMIQSWVSNGNLSPDPASSTNTSTADLGTNRFGVTTSQPTANSQRPTTNNQRHSPSSCLPANTFWVFCHQISPTTTIPTRLSLLLHIDPLHVSISFITPSPLDIHQTHHNSSTADIPPWSASHLAPRRRPSPYPARPGAS